MFHDMFHDMMMTYDMFQIVMMWTDDGISDEELLSLPRFNLTNSLTCKFTNAFIMII